jgi:NAD(P)-dependent dehydrogenase (short-subunit alcohol dehydrogenase family)
MGEEAAMGRDKVCAVVGVGPGNGEAFAKRFHEDGYEVALMSRTVSKLEKMAADLGEGAQPFACDATDPGSVERAFEKVAVELGPVDVLLWNAGSGVFGTVDDVDATALEQAWRINTLGLFAAARAVTPAMKDKEAGAIVVTGATASLRGGARFAAFAQAKGAQRNLAQSMARHYGPHGIHVALVIVDGMIDTPKLRASMPDFPADEKALKPAAIADAVHFLAHQHRSAWTFELDLRPAAEKW